MHQERLVAAPRFGYVVAMLCSLLSIMGSPSSRLYRSFVLFATENGTREGHEVKPDATPPIQNSLHYIVTKPNSGIVNEGIIACIGKHGTEGVVGLTQWFEKMELFKHKANCTVPCQCMEVTEKDDVRQYPRGEIKKLEFEMWNLKVKGNDVVAYSQRFQELALMCDRMFPEEIDQVEKYVGGLPDTIHGSHDCRSPPNVNTGANQRACFKCGAQGHFRKDCPKWKNNNNRGNQAGHAKAQAKVYAMGNAGANRTTCCPMGYYRRLHRRFSKLANDNDQTNPERCFSLIGAINKKLLFQTVEAEAVLYTNPGLTEGNEDFIAYCDS
ncbi:putative reverse transcriptase domain-containing protein [Tanacetum coccineum]